jgi:hypothetical protein
MRFSFRVSTLTVIGAAVGYCGAALLAGGAQALVGGASLAPPDMARSVVGVVGVRGKTKTFCTATAIAHNLILTAGHCAQPGTTYQAQYTDKKGQRKFANVAAWDRPPQFAIRWNTAIADFALMDLSDPLPAEIAIAVLDLHQPPVWPGDRFTIVGEGVTLKGLHQTGINRIATLVAATPISDQQIRLVDSSGTPVGACAGDSGSPVFQTRSGSTKVVGVVSWAGTTDKLKDCGGITGAILLSPYRQWIDDTMKKWGGSPANVAAPK